MWKLYKFRLYLTKSQQTKLENMFNICRYLYNWSLVERNEACEKEKSSVLYLDQATYFVALNKERPWFKNVYFLVLQDENGKYLSNNASAKTGLNKSISGVRWYKFLQILNYKTLDFEKQVVTVDLKNSNPRSS